MLLEQVSIFSNVTKSRLEAAHFGFPVVYSSHSANAGLKMRLKYLTAIDVLPHTDCFPLVTLCAGKA